MGKKNRTKWLGPLIIGVCLIATGVQVPQAMSFASNDACLECIPYWSAGCEPGWHKATWNGTQHDQPGGGSHASTCYQGTCWDNHPPCEVIDVPTSDLVELVQSAVLAGDLDRIHDLRVRYPTVVRVNTARSAIQVTGCNMRVAAHLALTKELLASLVELGPNSETRALR
jgi:hypothetical protein